MSEARLDMDAWPSKERATEQQSPGVAWAQLGFTFGGPALVLAASIAAVAAGLLVRPADTGTRRLVRSLGVVGAVVPWAYQYALRPWMLYWGTTSEEARGPLPGDNIIPHPQYESTHAITINAPADTVWPWLVQIGIGRGGLYTYDALENVIGLGVKSADSIIPELQNLQIGDRVPIGPDEATGLVVEAIEPNRLLALHTTFNPLNGQPVDLSDVGAEPYIDWSWVWVLHHIDEATTRLIVRVRGGYNASIWLDQIAKTLVESPHFIMERRMLLGIKERAERLAKARM